jgi:hypothetical protein
MSKRFRATKENSHIRRPMKLSYTLEHSSRNQKTTNIAKIRDLPIPIWPAEIGGSLEARDGIDFGASIIDHDIDSIRLFDTLCKVGMDFDEMAEILGFDRCEEGSEPFE